MELSELISKTKIIFGFNDMRDLKEKLFECVVTNDFDKYEAFHVLVGDLSVDWLQKIFQYYEADRKEKKQDYTPKSLAELLGALVGDSETIIDMCAGSGALTIQKWNMDKEKYFVLCEFDENVMPFLIFNMAIRNIKCEIHRTDVLSGEIFKTWKVEKGECYGKVINI